MNNLIENLFENSLYKEEYGDKETIREEFEHYINELSSAKKIILLLSLNEFNKKELKEHFLLKDVAENTINTNINRIKDILDVTKRDGKLEWLKLSNNEQHKINELLNEFIDNSYYIQEQRKTARRLKTKENSKDPKKPIKLFHSFFQDNNLRYVEGKPFKINLNEVYDVDLRDFVFSDFEESLRTISAILQIENPQELDNIDKYELLDDIRFINYNEWATSSFTKIEALDKKAEKDLIFTRGIIAKKSKERFSEIKRISYLCINPSCNKSENRIDLILKGTQKKTLKSCPMCKSPVEEIDKQIRDVLEVVIVDQESNLELKLKAQGKLSTELSYIDLGEEIEVIGHLETEDEKDTNKLNKHLELNNFNIYKNIQELDEDEIKEIEKEIDIIQNKKDLKNLDNKERKENLIDFLLTPFEYSHYNKEIKLLCLIPQVLQYRENQENFIFPLLISEPGQRKTSFFNTLEKISPKSKYIEMSELSEAKLKGSVLKDTQIKDIGLAIKNMNGSLFIDEIDKVATNDKRLFPRMFNSILSHQRIDKEKVGISIKRENLNLRVYYAMNSKKTPNDSQEFMELIGTQFDSSFFSRLMPIYIESISEDELIKSHQKKREGDLQEYYNSLDYEKFKRIILYLRNIEVDLKPIGNEINKALSSLLKALKNNYLYKTRMFEALNNIIIGLTKLKGKTIATNDEVKEALHLIKFTYESLGLTGLDKLNDFYNKLDSLNTPRDYIINHLNNIDKNEDTRQNIFSKLITNKFKDNEINNSIRELIREGLIFEPRKDLIKLVRV